MRFIFALAVVLSFASACCMPVYGAPAQTEPTEKEVLSKPLRDDLNLVVTEQRMVVTEKQAKSSKLPTTLPSDDEEYEVRVLVKYHYRFRLGPAGGGDGREVFTFDAYDAGKYGFGPFRPAAVLDAILVSDLLVVLYRENMWAYAAVVDTRFGKPGEVPRVLANQTLYKEWVSGGELTVGGKLKHSAPTKLLSATMKVRKPTSEDEKNTVSLRFVLDLDKTDYKWEKAD